MMKFTLEQARKYKGLSQSIMADKLGMTLQTYITYEKNRMIFRIDTAHKFSKIVEIPIDDIIFYTQEGTQ